MKANEKAKELLDRFLNIEGADDCGNSYSYVAQQCALISIDDKYNGIIYVCGELKARGELSEKIYLKIVVDMNNEREQLKELLK
jgi:hypothetical protein